MKVEELINILKKMPKNSVVRVRPEGYIFDDLEITSVFLDEYFSEIVIGATRTYCECLT